MKNKRLILLLIVSIIIVTTSLILISNSTGDAVPVYSLEYVTKKKLLINQYQIFDHIENNQSFISEKDQSDFAYSYSLPKNSNFIQNLFSDNTDIVQKPNVLLLKTSGNLEEQGTFFAIDNKGKTGNTFSGDSIYAIEFLEPDLLNKDSLKLFLFKIEKPEDKYIRTLTDSILLIKTVN